MKALALAVVLILAASAAHAAGPYDGSVPLSCRIEAVFTCSQPTDCVRGTAETVLLPPVLTVDVNRRVVSGDAAGRKAAITAVGHGNGRMLLHGDELQTSGGTAWNVVIEEASGSMTASVLAYGGGTLMFGVCSAS